MPDPLATDEDVAVEQRPCAYCGTLIHPESHRCIHCGGHVGLAWGTVHKEIFLFLCLAVMTAVGCLVPWNGRTPVLVADTPILQSPPAPGQPAPPPPPPKWVVTQEVTTVGTPMNGTNTLRGSIILAIALYGIIVGIFNALHRRLVMWPFVLNGFLALWVGLGGVIAAMGSSTWGHWKEWAQGKSVLEKYVGAVRAIPPGMLLLALVGVISVLKLVAGIVAAAGKSKGAAAATSDAARPAARRRGSRSKLGDADDTGGLPSDAGPISPEPPTPPPLV
jgi:hypothetical protein